MGKPRLQNATVTGENENEYVMQIAFENGHMATLRVLKDPVNRYSARDAISENYIYRNLFGQHNFRREPEEEKARAREILDAAIGDYRK